MLRAPLKTLFKTAIRCVTEIEVVVIMETDRGHIGYDNASASV